jgi:hypothetical protein
VCIIAAIALNELLEKIGSSIRHGLILGLWDPSDIQSNNESIEA